ncbi:hypothetical protein OHC33_003617 [Knufia fluminis]|uniref:Uncharacterized protein n=1 Tax=Knufia fluminis TaxID=191047 RepID=A0AAN8EMV4_9EURO|nr:hypothetical protein OHC33_003617 [Knufia fluminis]
MITTTSLCTILGIHHPLIHPQCAGIPRSNIDHIHCCNPTAYTTYRVPAAIKLHELCAVLHRGKDLKLVQKLLLEVAELLLCRHRGQRHPRQKQTRCWAEAWYVQLLESGLLGRFSKAELKGRVREREVCEDPVQTLTEAGVCTMARTTGGSQVIAGIAEITGKLRGWFFGTRSCDTGDCSTSTIRPSIPESTRRKTTYDPNVLPIRFSKPRTKSASALVGLEHSEDTRRRTCSTSSSATSSSSGDSIYFDTNSSQTSVSDTTTEMPPEIEHFDENGEACYGAEATGVNMYKCRRCLRISEEAFWK